MSKSSYQFMFIRLLFSLSLFLLLFTDSFYSLQPLCHEDESSALLQFKASFTLNKSASDCPLAYPKVSSWKLEGDSSSDCCSWDGVECDEHTGHVIGLNLSSSCLFGSINSNSTLFRLVHLQKLNLAHNHFNYSRIPSTEGNLSRLTYLNLSYSFFSGQIPSQISQLSKLSVLDLSFNYLYTESLTRLVHNLTSLEQLVLSYVNISSSIPEILANYSSLKTLSLRSCGLYGPIPSSLGNLTQLTTLDLSGNNLSGTVELEMFLKQNNFDDLRLSFNNLSLLINKTSSNAILPQFDTLELASCNLNQFPDFLRNQRRLSWLDLSSNNFQGLIPRWIYHLEALRVLILSHNFLTGFEQSPVVLPWSHLEVLSLNSNKLQGSVPIPPPSTKIYYVRQNELTGEISPLICNLSSLYALDLSYNKLRGILPSCLGNFSSFLSFLQLRGNNFHATIPDTWERGNNLKMVDFSENQLEGQLSRSLANCQMLEYLNVGSNRINDTFPFWLGNLPQMKVLVLRSNRFYGAILSPETNYTLPKLRIVDLSHNGFSGELPCEYFLHWNAMKVVDASKLTYMMVIFDTNWWHFRFFYTVKLTNKGIDMVYDVIQDFVIIIDLSSNKFEGDIPQVIGNLKALNLLNLSNNVLTGHIPLSLANLTELESLDLSHNKLSGEIPPQLTQLTFLEVFNVSQNYLGGPIPHGKQFDTFLNTSFEGNSGLCGNPLSKNCGNFKDSPPLPSTFKNNQGSKFPFEFGWKVVVIGYGYGLIVGVVIGQIVVTRKQDWFMKTFVIGQQKRRVNRRVRRN